MHRVRETMHRGALVAVLLGALIALAFAGGVDAMPPKTVISDTLLLEVNGGITPKASSGVIPSAAALAAEVRVRTLDGTHPPALEKLVVDLDENGFIDVRGIPICSAQALREDGEDACPGAIIGSGLAEFTVDRPPSNVPGHVPVNADLLLFNGGMTNGVVTLFAYKPIDFPLGEAVIVPIKVRRIDEGRFGSEAVVAIPKIEEGHGYLTSFRLKINKSITFKGRKKSVLTFRCVDGKARARVGASFADGTTLETSLTRPCLRKGAEPLAIAEGPSTEFELGVEARPERLSKSEPTPAELLLTGEIKRSDGTHPPALGELVVDLDRNISIDLADIPVCRSGLVLQSLPSSFDPRKECAKSIVGRGRATTEIHFDACCVVTQSELLLFNGGVRGGISTLYANFEITVPVPAEIVTTIKIKRTREGRYGSRATFSFPKIAGGSGTITSLRMRLFKRFRFEGEPRSLVTARCADGRLLARADLTFADSSRRHSKATHTCAQRD